MKSSREIKLILAAIRSSIFGSPPQRHERQVVRRNLKPSVRLQVANVLAGVRKVGA